MGKKYTTIRMDQEQYEKLVNVRKEKGLPVAVQVRNAVNFWLRFQQKQEWSYDEADEEAMSYFD